MYVMRLQREYDAWAFMGLMQSKLMLFLYRVSNQGESRVIPQIKASKLQLLPFPMSSAPESLIADISRLVKKIYALNSQLAHSKNLMTGKKLVDRLTLSTTR